MDRSYGNGKINAHIGHNSPVPCISKVTTPVNGLVEWLTEVLTLLKTGRGVWKHVATKNYFGPTPSPAFLRQIKVYRDSLLEMQIILVVAICMLDLR